MSFVTRRHRFADLPLLFDVDGGSRYSMTGDFDQDGRVDIVTANRVNQSLTFLLNTGVEPCGDVSFQRGDVDSGGTINIVDQHSRRNLPLEPSLPRRRDTTLSKGRRYQ